MSANTSIEWCDKTWNPTRGCSVISPGCANCFAMRQAHRFSGAGKPYEGLTKQTKAGPQWTGVIRTVEDALLEPLSWRKPQRVFVNSMSDLFHEDVPFEFVDRVFATMALAKRHTFQVLTKRAERMQDYLTHADVRERIANVIGFGFPAPAQDIARSVQGGRFNTDPDVSWPLPNVWLGVSVEDQKHADERIPLLLQTPAAVRFISAEPLLGPVDVRRYMRCYTSSREHGSTGKVVISERPGIDWIIAGGESGPGARPADLAWFRSLVEQVACSMGGTRLFVKQLGAVSYERRPYEGEQGTHAALANLGKAPHATRRWFRDWTLIHTPQGESFYQRHHKTSDKKGGDPSEWPDDLRVRQFPEVRQ